VPKGCSPTADHGDVVPLRDSALRCLWRGDFGSEHSLGVVNDGIAGALERRGVEVARARRSAMPDERPLVGIAQHWPPRFEPPTAGPFVLYQPWEFGCVPARWAEEIRLRVDEVWAPSSTARGAYLAAGVAPELVHVVPNGVDPARFRPDGPVRAVPERRGTVFLFVGGTTYRKGIDLLLEAWQRAFTAADDVTLVIKSFGSQTVYRGQTTEARIAELARRHDVAEIVLVDDELSFDEIPALYRAADVLVQPYRGEGFCLPALEALATGRPVIVTAGGPTDDFVTDGCAWRVASRRIALPDGILPPEYAPAGEAFLLEPELDALVDALRSAADADARAQKATRARPHAERFSWDSTGAVAEARLAELTGRTPVSEAAATVPGRRGTLFTALADWSRRESWAPALRAYAHAFGPDADTTLVLPAADEAAALRLVTDELAAAGLDPGRLPDVALADPGARDALAFELVADAVIASDSRPASRARRIVPPDPAALHAVANA
jgi:glycosyltransferase involved in cell wall biosynthesis